MIADLVGDNVGDCAARGADLFESIAAEVISAMILGGTMAKKVQLLPPLLDVQVPRASTCTPYSPTSLDQRTLQTLLSTLVQLPLAPMQEENLLLPQAEGYINLP